MSKYKQYFKISFALLLSFFLVQITTREIFVANTPNVRPNLAYYLGARLQSGREYFAGLVGSGEQSEETQTIQRELKDIPIMPLTKGVYAQENDKVSVTIVKVDEVEWKDYTFTVKGKTIKIRVPADKEPPTQEFMDEAFK